MRKPNTEKTPCPAGAESARAKSCPIFLTLGLIANKWSIRILYALLSEKKRALRFSELQRALDGITQRELSKQLREFEKAGIVDRHVFAQVPLRVEYTLTAIGRSLSAPIEALSRWAEKYGPAVQKKREEYEKRADAQA